MIEGLPIVSITVPFSGLTNYIIRIRKVAPIRNYNGDYRWAQDGFSVAISLWVFLSSRSLINEYQVSDMEILDSYAILCGVPYDERNSSLDHSIH